MLKKMSRCDAAIPPGHRASMSAVRRLRELLPRLTPEEWAAQMTLDWRQIPRKLVSDLAERRRRFAAPNS